MGGRTTISATLKGVGDEAWFRKEQEEKRSQVKAPEAISIRVSQAMQQQQQELFTMFGRKSSAEVGVGYMGGEVEEEEEEGVGRTFCCFPSSRRRRYSRPEGVVACDDGMEPGSPFSRRDADPASLAVLGRLRSLRALCSCCGSRRTSGKWIVEVSGVGAQKELGSRDHHLRTAGRWEVDVNDEYFKPPMWKQLVRKVKAQARHVQGSRNEVWLNYDPQSYEKNFDNGEFRQQQYNVHSLDENDQRAATDTALHTSLLHRFATAKSQQNGTTPTPLPTAA